MSCGLRKYACETGGGGGVEPQRQIRPQKEWGCGNHFRRDPSFLDVKGRVCHFRLETFCYCNLAIKAVLVLMVGAICLDYL